jgi:hypothetical protein
MVPVPLSPSGSGVDNGREPLGKRSPKKNVVAHANTSCRMWLGTDLFDLRKGISTVLKDKLVV